MQENIRLTAQLDLTRVSHDKFGPPAYGLVDFESDDGVSDCCVSSDGQDTFRFAYLGDRIGHCTAAKSCGQTGHGWGMSEPGAMINVVGLHHGPGEFLK